LTRPTVSSLGPRSDAVQRPMVGRHQEHDMMLVMGGNPAENHPVDLSGRLKPSVIAMQADCVDPRFTRTAATGICSANPSRKRHCIFRRRNPLRDRKQPDREGVPDHFTNASFIVKEGFKLPEDGLYSGSMRPLRLTITRVGIMRRTAAGLRGRRRSRL